MELLDIVGGHVKWDNHFRKQFGQFIKSHTLLSVAKVSQRCKKNSVLTLVVCLMVAAQIEWGNTGTDGLQLRNDPVSSKTDLLKKKKRRRRRSYTHTQLSYNPPILLLGIFQEK